MLPLPRGGEGNPGDVVEVRADIVVFAVTQRYTNVTSESSQERIDWWLEEGGDEYAPQTFTHSKQR
jgi:SET domain-containing protein 6